MSSQSILLVDDNPDDVALTLRAFAKNNILNNVVVARDGVEALDYLFGTGNYAGRDNRDLPKLVLLDLNMPRMGGLDVLKRVRANALTRMLPFVILTSSREDQDVVNSYSLGANSYVRKPVDFLEFVDAVRQLNMYWLILNEPLPDAVGPVEH